MGVSEAVEYGPSLHDGQLLFAQDPGGLPNAFNFLFQEVSSSPL